MRVKFLSVSQHENADRLSLHLEQSLSQIAVAFGHSFLIRNVTMEEAVRHLGEEDTVISVLAEYAAIAPLAQQAGAFALERAFFHEFNSSLLKKDIMPRGTIVSPADDSDNSEAALRACLDHSGKSEIIDIKRVPLWIEKMIKSPDKMGDLVCDFDAGMILKQLVTSLYGLSSYFYETMIGKDFRINVSPVERNSKAENISPFGVYFAAVDSLLGQLKLEQEGNCLKTSVNNILDAGWRTEDCAMAGYQTITTEKVCDLVNEQIALVGELMSQY